MEEGKSCSNPNTSCCLSLERTSGLAEDPVALLQLMPAAGAVPNAPHHWQRGRHQPLLQS